MNVIETMVMTESLIAAGYSILSTTACTVTVADPVACSSGGKRWVESKPVQLRTSAGVRRFIMDRE